VDARDKRGHDEGNGDSTISEILMHPRTVTQLKNELIARVANPSTGMTGVPVSSASALPSNYACNCKNDSARDFVEIGRNAAAQKSRRWPRTAPLIRRSTFILSSLVLARCD
jgi:hypothetical protein